MRWTKPAAMNKRLDVLDSVARLAADEHARQGAVLNQAPDSALGARQEVSGGLAIDQKGPQPVAGARPDSIRSIRRARSCIRAA